MSLILGEEKKVDVEYLDACRLKRNTVEYDCVGAATENDAEELIRFAKALRKAVLAWMRKKHPGILPP